MSPIQRQTQTIVMTAPITDSAVIVVRPMTSSVIPRAVRIGSLLGPGRWISSLTGGSSGSTYLRSRLPLQYYPLLWELRSSL